MKKSPLLVAAAVCLIILVLGSTVWSIGTLLRWFNFGMDGRALMGGRDFGVLPDNGSFTIPENGELPDSSLMPRQGEEGGQFDPSQLPEDFQGGRIQPGDRTGGMGGRQMGGGFLNPFGILSYLGIAVSVLALLLGIIAVIGLLKGKKWGAIWAIIAAVLVTLTSISAFLGYASGLTIGFAAAKIILAIAVITLVLLPAARRVYSPREEDLLLDEDEI
jgi:hypothetical protein